MKKKIIIAIVIFILCFLGIGVFEYIEKNDNDKNEVNNTSDGNTIENIAKEENTIVVEKNKYEDELFGEHYEKAEKILKDMTLEEKVRTIISCKISRQWCK